MHINIWSTLLSRNVRRVAFSRKFPPAETFEHLHPKLRSAVVVGVVVDVVVVVVVASQESRLRRLNKWHDPHSQCALGAAWPSPIPTRRTKMKSNG